MTARRILYTFAYSCIAAILVGCSAHRVNLSELMPKDSDKYTLVSVTTTSFENSYNDKKRLTRSKTYQSDSLEGDSIKLISDIFYFYDTNNKLRESKTYDMNPIYEKPSLSVDNLYSDTLDQTFCLYGYPTDTTLYMWSKKNRKGLVIEEYLDTNLIPDYMGYHNKYSYDGNDRKTQMEQTDLLTNENSTTEYRYSTKRDTLFTESYRNNVHVGGITKTLKQGNIEISFTYYPKTDETNNISYNTKTQRIYISYANNNKNVTTTLLDKMGKSLKIIDETYQPKE